MRNVNRNPSSPRSLAKHGQKWKDSLSDALAKGDTASIKYRRRFYNQSDVRTALVDMYQGLCCYCEGEVVTVGADQIEHRMPTTKFPEETFEWNNLHLACSDCNRAKSDKWDSTHSILDSAVDSPIEYHLNYRSSETGTRRISLTKRGRTTIEHTDLNREELRISRGRVFMRILGLIENILERLEDNPDDPDPANRIEELLDMRSDSYGSMIRWAIEKYLDPHLKQRS